MKTNIEIKNHSTHVDYTDETYPSVDDPQTNNSELVAWLQIHYPLSVVFVGIGAFVFKGIKFIELGGKNNNNNIKG